MRGRLGCPQAVEKRNRRSGPAVCRQVGVGVDDFGRKRGWALPVQKLSAEWCVVTFGGGCWSPLAGGALFASDGVGSVATFAGVALFAFGAEPTAGGWFVVGEPWLGEWVAVDGVAGVPWSLVLGLGAVASPAFGGGVGVGPVADELGVASVDGVGVESHGLLRVS